MSDPAPSADVGANDRHGANPWPATVLLVATVGVEIVWLVTRPGLHGRATWLPLVGAIVLHAALMGREHRRPSLRPGAIVVGALIVTVVAVVLPPWGSRDVYSYAVYGRMLAVHHANPYLTSPHRWAHDSLLRHVAPSYRRGTTIYGPLFTVFSAVGALAFRSSATAARLFFQGADGLALLATVAVLARRKARPDVLVFVGLSPVMVAVVNGGHNDLLVGLCLLLGIVRVREDRPVAGGLLLAAAALIKLLALPAVAGVVVALLLVRAWRGARTVAGIVVVATVVAYALAGGSRALSAVGKGTAAISRATAWQAFRLAYASPRGRPYLSIPTVSHLAILVIGAIAVVFVLRVGRRAEVASMAGGFVLIFLLGSQYVLPWYSAVVYPLGILLVARARWIVHLQGTLLLLVYISSPGTSVLSVPFELRLDLWAPWLSAALLVAFLAVWSRAGDERGRAFSEVG